MKVRIIHTGIKQYSLVVIVYMIFLKETDSFNVQLRAYPKSTFSCLVSLLLFLFFSFLFFFFFLNKILENRLFPLNNTHTREVKLIHVPLTY